MPLTYARSSIFESNAQALVNPVNCVGRMGRVLANEFRQRYPDMYRMYREMCRHDKLKIGLVARLHLPNGQPQIILFPTKDHWTHGSQPY